MRMNRKIGLISKKFFRPYEGIINTTASEIIRNVSGTMTISLPNAIANELLDVKAYGGTKQSGTPTPSDPVDITCNNGNVGTTQNFLDMSAENIVVGKYISNSGVVTDSSANFYNSKYIPVVSGGVYTRSTSTNIRYASIMEYDINKTFVKRTLFDNGSQGKTNGTITLQSQTAFVLFGSNPFSINVDIDMILGVDRQFEYYNAPTSYSPYGMFVTGTQEVIEDSVGNASIIENLFQIGSYKDEQEVLTGNIVRRVGIKILDGSENWTQISSPLGNIFEADLLDQNMFAHLICSHFVNNAPTTDDTIHKSAGSSIVQIRYDTATNVQDFIQFLITQYSNRTPVVVVYGLNNTQTETVSGQTLDIQTGSNTIEITSASLNDLTLSAKYKASA